MKLQSFQVKKYKSVDDSNEIVLSDVTCLVGKNESGKTALLEALGKINAVGPLDPNFDLVDYPVKEFRPNKRENFLPIEVIYATFKLDASEILAVKKELGEGISNSFVIKITKNYNNDVMWDMSEFSESQYLQKLVDDAGLVEEHKARLHEIQTVSELTDGLKLIGDPTESIKSLIEKLESLGEKPLESKIRELVSLPKFFYFDEYSILPGEISLNKLEDFLSGGKSENDNIVDEYFTVKSLLDLASVSYGDFSNEDRFEYLIRNIETANQRITSQIFEYYSQNTDLEVRVENQKVTDAQDKWIDTILHLRIFNRRHGASVSFDKRSRGFVWFFSFLVAFSNYLDSEDEIILLLDEPGLSLHAKGQEDILRYINEKLSPKIQVIYTTHSPFMIDKNNWKGIRTVQDIDNEGTKVFDDPLYNDEDTVFPLQNALGYSLGQSLFISPNNLLVEGPSDFIYLSIASQQLEDKDRQSLPVNITIIPVGGASKLSTFITLLGGNKLNNGVLMDYSKADEQKIQSLWKGGFLKRSKLLKYSEFTNSKEADVEDLFDQETYLDLVRNTYQEELIDKEFDVSLSKTGHPRVCKRISEIFKSDNINNGNFQHYSPARYLLLHPEVQTTLYTDEVLERFEKIFVAIKKRILEED